MDRPKGFMMPTAADIAADMLQMFNQNGRLVQSRAARHVRTTYGEDFVYKNKNNNWAIRADILDEFRKLTDDGTVVWSRSGQYWRRRRSTDPEGRMVR